VERNDLLSSIIDGGIEEVRRTYQRQDQREKREGAIEGFEACRGLGNEELQRLLMKSRADTLAARKANVQNYWRIRMREIQIEWTLNVLSAAMQNNGERPLVPPTTRGFLRAAAILGVASV
jgi:hypothetical protein